MTISTIYSYEDRKIVDIKTLILALRFIITNLILALILLFLTLEEIDWYLFASKEKFRETVVDNTSWNIKTIF